MSKKLIYICSPLRGNYEENIAYAELYCRLTLMCFPNVVPIAPHIYFPRFLDDTDEKERKLGMDAGIALLDKCDELWVFGIDNPSDGMRAEIEHAEKRSIPIRDGHVFLGDAVIQKVKG